MTFNILCAVTFIVAMIGLFVVTIQGGVFDPTNPNTSKTSRVFIACLLVVLTAFGFWFITHVGGAVAQ